MPLTHAEQVYTRMFAVVEDFNTKCEAGRNGNQMGPSQLMAQAIMQTFRQQKELIIRFETPPVTASEPMPYKDE